MINTNRGREARPLIREINDLKAKLNRYKKALELACYNGGCNIEHIDYGEGYCKCESQEKCNQCRQDYFLAKADKEIK